MENLHRDMMEVDQWAESCYWLSNRSNVGSIWMVETTELPDGSKVGYMKKKVTKGEWIFLLNH